MYGPDSIQKLDDATAFIRRQPRMFAGPWDEVRLAEMLLHDALQLGVTRVLIEKHSGWYVVSADVDWLQLKGKYCHNFTPFELFQRIVPFPEDGDNAMRREVLIAAFASEVISSSRHEKFVVNGHVPPDSPIWDQICGNGFERSVAFRGILPMTIGSGGQSTVAAV